MASETEIQEIETLICREAEGHGYPVPREAARAMAQHLAMTLRWGRIAGLTAIDSVEEAVRRHVVESIASAAWIEADRGPLLDVGSGNGYPAIPIKCLHPALSAILLEPALKKSIFLRQVASSLSFEKVDVRRERIDRGADLGRHAPLGTISMRAVAVARAVIDGAPAALAPGGRVVLLIGDGTAKEVLAALPRGLRLVEQAALPGRRRASLVVIEKE